MHKGILCDKVHIPKPYLPLRIPHPIIPIYTTSKHLAVTPFLSSNFSQNFSSLSYVFSSLGTHRSELLTPASLLTQSRNTSGPRPSLPSLILPYKRRGYSIMTGSISHYSPSHPTTPVLIPSMPHIPSPLRLDPNTKALPSHPHNKHKHGN